MKELMDNRELLRSEGDFGILELMGYVCMKRIVSKVLNKWEIRLCKCMKGMLEVNKQVWKAIVCQN